MKLNGSKMRAILCCALLLGFCLAPVAQAETGDSYFRAGNEYYHQGLWDKAIDQYRLALKINPDHLPSLHNLGLAYQSKKDFDNAIATFEKIKTLDRLYVPVYISLGLVYVQKGLYKQAQMEYAKAIALEPNNLVAHLNLAVAYAKQADYPRALRAARRGRSVVPSNPHLHLLMGNIYFIEKKYVLAKSEYLKALKLQPQTPGARMILALCMAHLGNFDGALTQMEIVRNLDAMPAQVERTTGQILALRFYAQKTGWKEAVDTLRSAASKSNDDLEIYKELGDLLAAKAQYTDARRWYLRVLDNRAACQADKEAIAASMQSWPKEENHANVSSKL